VSLRIQPSLILINHTYPHTVTVSPPDTLLSISDVYYALLRLKKTATGPDSLPSWFLKENAIALSPTITTIFNASLSQHVIPDLWRIAAIHPIPKVNTPTAMSQLRPISVTSVLCRVLERLVCKRYLLNNIPPGIISDQFGFRPTGSTTAALIALLHHIYQMLEKHSFVRCLLIDFSKAFDVVSHPILFNKVSMLPIPNFIKLWIKNFLTNRKHYTVISGIPSGLENINLGVVQAYGRHGRNKAGNKH
jgi:hypothetical protein